MNPDIERIWTWARNRHGNELDNRTPSRGISAVLVALLDGPAHGSEVAQRAGQSQPNVTSCWLPKLERFRFVNRVDEVLAGEVKTGNRAGGRAAVIWGLTRDGKELAELCAAELAQQAGRVMTVPDVLATCPCGAPIIRDPKRSHTSAREQSRKYCSRVCGGRYGGGLAFKAPDILGQCLTCGTDIVRNPRRSRHSERNRKYCSRACSGAARRGLPFPGTPRKRTVKPAPPPAVEPERPVWRPSAPGWGPVPQVTSGRRAAG